MSMSLGTCPHQWWCGRLMTALVLVLVPALALVLVPELAPVLVPELAPVLDLQLAHSIPNLSRTPSNLPRNTIHRVHR
jgi:hypothetical protein